MAIVTTSPTDITNDWAKTLGISFTFVEAANPVPRIKLSSATGSLEMHLYRAAGETVGDSSIPDMEALGMSDEAITLRKLEILKVAEPLKHDSPAKEPKKSTQKVN